MWSHDPPHPFAWSKILGGYTIEQDELTRFLKAQGFGTEPGEPEFTVEETWMTLMSWQGVQPRHGDPKMLLLWPQCASYFPPPSSLC